MEPSATPGKPRTGAALARGAASLVFAFLALDGAYESAQRVLHGYSFELFFAILILLFGSLAWTEGRAAARAWRGEPAPSADWSVRIFVGFASAWAVWFFIACLPYFMRPYTMQKERKAAILARVPEVARLEALDEAGLRALTTALIPVVADPDKPASAGAREALVRVASRPGAPKDLLVPFFVGDMEATKMIPSNAAWGLAQLGEEGRAALIAAVNGPGDWAPQAAAFELSRMKPPALDAIPALEEALAKAPEHRRFEFRLALDRIRGRKR